MVARTTNQQRYAFDPDYVTEPGEILQETIETLGITQKELAARTDYSTKHVNQMITGKARITPEAAVRLERVTRVPARFWNNLETQYQDRKARLADRKTAVEDMQWLDEIPTKELIKRGALPTRSNPSELLEASLSFFGVSSVAAWRAGWTTHQIAFRKSAGADDCTAGIAAWVRLAEVAATKTQCEPFNADRFQVALQKIRKLTLATPREFVPAMKTLCAESGVALALIPEIPGNRVSGAARWLTSTKAMIAVNLWGKRNDLFWFTFFHEAGHILNDGRDEIYVDVEYTDDPRERAANKFAAEILIPPSHAAGLRALKSKAAVRAYAQRVGIHPGIVVGRLRHDKIIPYTHMHDLLDSMQWAEG